MGLGNISEDQKKEFADFFAYLMKNPEIINVIENKDFNATINDLIMKMFKSAISYTEKDFKSTELHVERLKKEPQKLVRETNIYFDFDDVIVNFVPEWIEWINTRLEAEGLEAGYTIDDVRNFWWFNQLGDTLVEKGLDTQKINAIIWEFLQSDIYQNIEHHNNTINIMRYLKGVGFNVKILSAGVSRSKEKFVEEHLTFLDAKKDMIITANKSIVQPGVLVDDGGHNAVEMVENNNMAYCVLIDTKYNQHIQTGKRITRVKLEDTKQVLNLILAKAYSNEARKHNFSLILKDLGYDLPEGLENKSIDAVLKMLGEMSLPSKTSSKNKE
jgi:5'(3')-deoxyribonucleotidase